jgi:hypothetical protein
MPRRPPPPRSPRLIRILADLGAGKVTEAYICDATHFVEGLCTPGPRGRVTINPMISVVDTLIHECLHAQCPQWSERSIKTQTTRLMRQLSDAEVQAIYEQYQRCKRTRTSSVLSED